MDKQNLTWVFRAYTLLALAYLAFIFVASFYPTRAIPDPELTLAKVLAANLENIRFNFHNLRDIATNIVLYMPLGLLFCAASSARGRPRFLSIGLLGGFWVSCFVEVTQIFIGRYSDAVDVLSNSLGFVAGYWIMWWAIYRFRVDIAHFLGLGAEDADSALNTLQGLRFGYVSVAYFVSLLPLNVTVSLGVIYDKVNVIGSTGLPRIILDPFYHFRSGHDSLHTVLLNTLVVLPFALLTVIIRLKTSRAAIAYTAVASLLLMFVIEVSQLFIINGYSDVFIVLIAPIVGGLVAYSLQTWGHFGRVTRAGHESGVAVSQREVWLLAVMCYGLFIMLWSWSPFVFETALAELKVKLLQDSNWLPFKAHFSSRSLSAAIDIVREVCIYIPLGLLLMRAREGGGRAVAPLSQAWAMTVSVAAGFAFALLMELSQLMVKGRYVDVTDPLLAGFGCLLGTLLLPLFTTSQLASGPRHNS